MKHQLLITVLLLTISQTLYAQTAENLELKTNDEIDNKEYQAAVADCDSAIRIDPNYDRAYYYCGLAKVCLANYTGAIVDLDRAISLDAGMRMPFVPRGWQKAI